MLVTNNIIGRDKKIMKNNISILTSYKEGSRTGNISLLKGKRDDYQVYIDWDDPRYNKTLIYSGKLQQCINFSVNRFGIEKQLFDNIKSK
jgi:hypothetical protein